MGCLGEPLFAAEQLDPGEHEAGIAVQFVRHRLEQRAGIGGLAVAGDARLGQRDLIAAEPLGGAQGGIVFVALEQKIHPRRLVARRQQRTEQVERGVFGILRHGIVAPGFAD